MMPLERQRLADGRQLTLAVIGAAVLLLAGIVLSFQNEQTFRARAIAQARVQADILASSVTAALAFDDADATREYVSALSANPEIASVAVYDSMGQQVVNLVRTGEKAPPSDVGPRRAAYSRSLGVEVVTPVLQGQTRLGAVYLRTAPEPLARTIGRHGSLALLVVMAFLILAALGRAAAELEGRARALSAANDTLRGEMLEREKVEEALRQSQKMESLGQLTGGVAHDFNNLLTVVIGGLETIGRQLAATSEDTPATGRIRRASDMAMQAAQRAAILTRRLLAFSRRQPLEPQALDINRMTRDMAELIHRTLGETIALETVLAAGLWRTLADQSQLENALINLAVNARDAMPDGGKLTIETANTVLDEAYVEHFVEAIAPGQYVLIAVTDTGVGMDRETLDRAFEPFFTTKEVGKGTGLGLSQVYGFVRQSGGHLQIYSEPGVGTTVKIYLPRLVAEAAAAEPEAPIRPIDVKGDETILVVEDHEDLRGHSASILRELGYTVFEAADGPSALEILRGNPQIALLFTDIVLPGGMNGRQIADVALGDRPELKVLFTTGYSRNAILHNGMLDAHVSLINKPFTFDELASKVRRLLDEA